MRIWFVELGEPLPFLHQQRLLRYGEFTRLLAGRGHQVTWWACDFSHQTKTFVGEPNARVMFDGVEIVLAHGPGYRRNVGLGRIRHLKVHAKSLKQLIANEPPPDIIVSAMPTVESCEVIIAYGRQHSVPVIVDIRDEWPEDYVRWLPKALRPVARAALFASFGSLKNVCRDARALTAVSERQLEYGLRAAGRSRSPDDRVFHTGARDVQYPGRQFAAAIEFWRQAGLSPERFICTFSGTMAPSRPLGPIIEAVKRLDTRMPISLVIAGRGDREAEYRAQAEQHPSIHFAGWIGALEMAALFEISDVLLAPYRPDYGFSMPTKIFDYFAAGRPLISSCPGEAEALLREHGVGLQYRFDDSADVEQALVDLYDDPERRRAMGVKGRELFERYFAIGSILERYADYLEGFGSASP